MLKYDIQEGEGARILTVKADDLQRWALHDSNDIPLEWKPYGKQALAVIRGHVKVYRKPYGLTFHKEYMLHNKQALRLGARFGTIQEMDTLVRNLYEYIKEI